MKKFRLVFLIFSISLIVFCLSTAGKESCSSWYIKRNGDKAPRFPAEAKVLDDYNCIYIDKRASEEGKKVIYLTFDAGYENGNVERILDVLHSHKVPAAFFVLDNIILKNADLVSRMTKEGHLVCNHTKNHKNLSYSSTEDIKKDLEALEQIYKNETGEEMSRFFRFPEGKYSLNSVKSVSELGYTTVFWSFAYDDWDNCRQIDSKKAMKKIIENTHDGAIFLFHPTSKTNADIMDDLITEWKNRGYSFGTLEDIVR